MTKRFCDQCEKEIAHHDPYFVEETRATNVIVSASQFAKPTDMIMRKRDLCVLCSPVRLPTFEPLPSPPVFEKVKRA